MASNFLIKNICLNVFLYFTKNFHFDANKILVEIILVDLSLQEN